MFASKTEYDDLLFLADGKDLFIVELERLTEYVNRFESLYREHESLLQERDNLLNAQEQQEKDHEAELARLRSGYEDELTRLRSERVDELNQVRAEHEAELARLRSEHADELARVKSGYEDELARLRAECNNLMTAQEQRKKEHENRLAEVQTRNKIFKTRLTDRIRSGKSKKYIIMTPDRLNDLYDRGDKLMHDCVEHWLSDLEQKNMHIAFQDYLEEVLNEVRTNESASQKKIDELTLCVVSAENAKESAEIAQAALEEQNADLQADYNDLNAKYDELQFKYNTLVSDHEDLESRYNNLDSEKERLQKEYDELNTDNDALKQINNNAKSDKDELTSKYFTLKTEYSTLETKRDQLELELKSFKRKYKMSKDKRIELQKQLDLSDTKNADLKKQLNDEKQRNFPKQLSMAQSNAIDKLNTNLCTWLWRWNWDQTSKYLLVITYELRYNLCTNPSDIGIFKQNAYDIMKVLVGPQKSVRARSQFVNNQNPNNRGSGY